SARSKAHPESGSSAARACLIHHGTASLGTANTRSNSTSSATTTAATAYAGCQPANNSHDHPGAASVSNSAAAADGAIALSSGSAATPEYLQTTSAFAETRSRAAAGDRASHGTAFGPSAIPPSGRQRFTTTAISSASRGASGRDRIERRNERRVLW